MKTPDPLSRRERQAMDILYRLGEAGVGRVREEMADPPSYSAVRALMSTLLDKGHVLHRREGTRYLYRPAQPRSQARRSALSRVVDAFFDGAPASAAGALLEMSEGALPPGELDRLRALVAQAEAEGR